MSAAVKSVPSCHLTPRLSLKVYVSSFPIIGRLYTNRVGASDLVDGTQDNNIEIDATSELSLDASQWDGGDYQVSGSGAINWRGGRHLNFYSTLGRSVAAGSTVYMNLGSHTVGVPTTAQLLAADTNLLELIVQSGAAPGAAQTYTYQWNINGADVGTDGQLPADGEPGPSPRRGTDVLVVGTIEPRKGVEAVLDAAAELHRRGSPVRFTLVGTKGWIGDSTLRRLQAADAGEQNLRWLQRVGDADLVELYRSADLLLAPSRAEGYGLPVVEARAWGLPVLARDLPVFREVGGTDTRYFGTDAELPDAIEAALAAPTPGGPVSPRSWSAAAADVLAALPGDATGRC